jgi:hypothetical protein
VLLVEQPVVAQDQVSKGVVEVRLQVPGVPGVQLPHLLGLPDSTEILEKLFTAPSFN